MRHLAASLFHFRELEIRDVKQYLRDRGVSVDYRLCGLTWNKQKLIKAGYAEVR